MQHNKVMDDAAIEGLIAQVRGVMAVRVVRDPNGQIDELHVVGHEEELDRERHVDLEGVHPCRHRDAEEPAQHAGAQSDRRGVAQADGRGGGHDRRR